MIGIKSLLTACLSAATLSSAAPTGQKLEERSEVITASTTGTYGGYYFSNYVETGSDTLTLGTGTYSLSWSSSNTDVVSGIGWSTGSARTVTYTGSLNAGGDSLLALYGWTTSPLVEYYVIETYGTYNPGSAGTHKGTVTSDGATYDIYEVVRSNAPSIQGTQTFNQYLSIRQSKRTSGTITFANHIAAWANVGLTLGAYNYQIMATEGYESTGTSSITIS
ncbi:family 11 glycoside hydrolase [Cryphonectria parasitica EP155]|uniref:Endo-1,4-beta-xylanase n=1 Tax=Cryphonectria parasitica (strain ATCC 38755 / EP155) TaxID=660469 RepID=A0A9P4XV61_CRYP1|nr:family 11 glycoside hydrolase [Cryphonectria parasitica EP155]KAF3761381.1 family 11 glycoside hydrolase [Cryphonectria parasitica EP155]